MIAIFAFALVAFLIILLSLSANVKAEHLDMDVYVNGTMNMTISIEVNVSDMRVDLYGTNMIELDNGSVVGPKDAVLQDSFVVSRNQMKDICYNASWLWDQWASIPEMPPQDFYDYVKGLGYDDQFHVFAFWAICQQEDLVETMDYIKENEDDWRRDRVGISEYGVIWLIRDAIRFLNCGESCVSGDWLGGEEHRQNSIRVGLELDKYFASDKDVDNLKATIQDLQFRTEALENTMEIVEHNAYCKGKEEVINKYQLTPSKEFEIECGKENVKTESSNSLTGSVTSSNVDVGIAKGLKIALIVLGALIAVLVIIAIIKVLKK